MAMSLSELRPQVRRKTLLAGKSAFVVGYNRMRGMPDNAATCAANSSWDDVMEAVDLAYGTCTCLEAGYSGNCPSLEQHSTVAGFIDEMELIGQRSAVEGIPLNRNTITAQTRFLLRELEMWS